MRPDLTDRVLREMQEQPHVRVKLIHSEQGVFVSAALRDKTLTFLAGRAPEAA